MDVGVAGVAGVPLVTSKRHCWIPFRETWVYCVECDELYDTRVAGGAPAALTMRAFVITAPGEAGVQEVEPPVAATGEVVVDVERAGVCGTDVEIFTGHMQYLEDGHAHYPMRIGHEWMGTVTAVGDGVDPEWLGQRVTGDTMLGCGVCRRCLAGYQHVCEFREEVGIRGGRAGALAEQLAVPAPVAAPPPLRDGCGTRRARGARRERPARRGGRGCP